MGVSFDEIEKHISHNNKFLILIVLPMIAWIHIRFFFTLTHAIIWIGFSAKAILFFSLFLSFFPCPNLLWFHFLSISKLQTYDSCTLITSIPFSMYTIFYYIIDIWLKIICAFSFIARVCNIHTCEYIRCVFDIVLLC